MSHALWFAGLLGLVIAAAVASGRGRARATEVIGRGVAAIAAVAYAALVVAAVWLWGGEDATDGRADRLRDGATVAVTLEGTRVPLGTGARATLGHDAGATLQLPGEGARTLATIAVDARGTGSIAVAAGVGERAPRLTSSLASDPSRACREPGPHAFELPVQARLVLVECEGARAVAAWSLERTAAQLAVTPLALGRGRPAPERRALHAGEALRIGSSSDALPNLVTWDVPAPSGVASMLAVPLDPTDCSAWATAGGATRARGGGCHVELGAFELSAVTFVPDADGVISRAVWGALLVGAPALGALLIFALSPRRGRGARAFGRVLRLAVLGAGLVALGCWRLLWAHRIDMADPDTRVDANVLAAIAIGAALAGNAVLSLDVLDGRGWVRRASCALLGWAGWLAGAVLLTGHEPAISTVTVGVLGLSAIAAIVPVLGELAGRRPLPPELGLIGVAIAAIAARSLGMRGALVKLGLAYATVLLGHAALRAVLARARRAPPDPGDPPHASARGVIASLAGSSLSLASLLVAVAALAMLDTGVTLAIAGVGLALAMLVAGHDAIYDAADAGRLGLLEREHARLLSAHGLATAGLAIGIGTAAVAASDRALLSGGAVAMLHAPLIAAGLFGLAAAVARSHRRSWLPWLAAALAALAVWGMREAILERAMAGDGVASRRVAAVVEPGYALLRDDHAFVANVSAWREAATATEASAWRGQGYFGAAIRDPGVAHSIDNDYLAVLVARETGVAGLLQSVVLLLVLVVGSGAIASVRLPHASRPQRARWLVTGVAGVLVVYQPLAALGIVPLTGLTWPGLGIDSPGELWLFVIGAIWCMQGAEPPRDRVSRTDERVRAAPRLARARMLVAAALVACGLAAVALVVRAGVCALSRANDDDERVTAAIAYASTLACPTPEGDARTFDDALPAVLAGKPSDGATARFERELLASWRDQRAALARALTDANTARSAPAAPADPWLDAAPPADDARPDDDPPAARPGRSPRAGKARRGTPAKRRGRPLAGELVGRAVALFELERQAEAGLRCPARAGAWRIAPDGGGCRATLSIGWPDVEVAVRAGEGGVRATCSVELPDEAVAQLRTRIRAPRPRIRVVSAAIGASADDAGELVLGGRIVRLREGAPRVELAGVEPGITPAREVTLGDTVIAVRASPRNVVLRGDAELFVAETERGAGWRRWQHSSSEVVLDRVTLIAAGPPARRVVAEFRPPRAWRGAAVMDSLLADSAGDRARRVYPHGAAIPELGWVNPYAVERSLGLDGWIHAYAARPADRPVACGTLAPPPIARDEVCSPSPLDGVLECRVAIQPQLARDLRGVAERILREPTPITGRQTVPVRVAFVALRGDTGEILAQGNLAAGRPALAYAPADARAEAALVRLRDQPGEAAAEKVEWNLPIAVGSTFKPIVARAAEQAFPDQLATLSLTAAGHATGCRKRRGVAIDPIAGHCPPTSLAGQPTTADVHDFLARSPNWFQAALGLVGLGLPDARWAVKDRAVTFADVVGSDLATWPTDSALTIDDAHGPILGKRTLSIAGLRRTPLWTRVEALLGRPLCTLGDRATCERTAARADVCAARALPIRATADLRNLVALGPDRIDPYPDSTRRAQTAVPVAEYLQLLRGSGVHAVGSLAQITDAFGRVIYDPSGGSSKLAASWFPAPRVGTLPAWSCAAATGRTNTVLGADGGLCAVVRPNGTAHAGVKDLLSDPGLVIYGAKTGTVDSLADLARSPSACARWNASHVAAARLDCGRAPPDDSLLVIAFGVITPKGTIPITLGLQLQRGGKSAATKAAPVFVQAIARYLR